MQVCDDILRRITYNILILVGICRYTLARGRQHHIQDDTWVVLDAVRYNSIGLRLVSGISFPCLFAASPHLRIVHADHISALPFAIRVPQRLDNNIIALDMFGPREGQLDVFPVNHIVSIHMVVGDLFNIGGSC